MARFAGKSGSVAAATNVAVKSWNHGIFNGLTFCEEKRYFFEKIVADPEYPLLSFTYRIPQWLC